MTEKLILGKYTKGKHLGEGGLAIVYEGFDVNVKRPVALKVLREEFLEEDDVSGSFQYEAEVLGRLDHPNVPAVFDLGKEEDLGLLYAMQLVPGRDFEQLLSSSPGTTTANANHFSIFERVCHTVAYAHGEGYIHRDLKPENIVIGKHGKVFVTDWGLAKKIGGDEARPAGAETIAGTIKGTPLYMSPEQAEGDTEHIDYRTDVFALGVLLYRLLTGTLPFEGDDIYRIIIKVRKAEVEEPLKRNPAANKVLSAVCMKALSKDPELRYPTASEFADDVSRALVGRRTTAYSPTLGERIVSWCALHPKTVTAVVTGMILLAALIAGQWVAWQNEQSRIRVRLVELDNLHIMSQAIDEELATCRLADGGQKCDELEAVRNILTWYVRNNVIRITERVGSKQGANVESWPKELRIFCYEALIKEIQNTVEQGKLMTAHLLVTLLLEHPNVLFIKIGPSQQLRIENLRTQIEHRLKKERVKFSKPNWKAHLDRLQSRLGK